MPGATSEADLGVYLHVPFCDRVCPYCDFAVEAVGGGGALDPALEGGFVERIARELEGVLAAEPALAGRPLATVYLGGGTPSLLAPAAVERLLALVRGAFAGDPEEVTLELNPGTLEVARAPGYRDAGVTRLSVGVQSLEGTTLRRLGRAHGGGDALRGLEACLGAGFASISADLIYGAPGQRACGAFADLERVLALGVPHVSAYALTLEPGTPFHTAQARGRLALPAEDEVIAMQRGVRARCAAAGLEQYEISSFARAGHRSRHNQRYWLRRDVLGLGPSAATLLGGRRWTNERARPAWERAVDGGRRPLAELEELGAETARRETLWLGLRRLEGVSRAAYLRRFGTPPEADLADELRELRALGLVEDAGGALRLTERGILFADEAFLRLLGR